MRQSFEYNFNRDHKTPTREQRDHYTGPELERIILGDSGVNTDYTTYRNTLDHLQTTHPKWVETRNGKTVFKKCYALASALNVTLGEFESPIRPELSSIAKGLQKLLQMRDASYELIPTGNTPIDFDYGTDALVLKNPHESTHRSVAREEAPYLSLGITSFNKKQKERTSGKTQIQSDVELYIPSEKDQLALLQDREQFALMDYLQTIAQAIDAQYSAIAANEKINPIWIDFKDFRKN